MYLSTPTIRHPINNVEFLIVCGILCVPVNGGIQNVICKLFPYKKKNILTGFFVKQQYLYFSTVPEDVLLVVAVRVGATARSSSAPGH